MIPTLAQLYIRFHENVTLPEGLSLEYRYPVYGMEIKKNEKGIEQTRMLIANRVGQFLWVPMSDVRRVPPPKNKDPKYLPYNQEMLAL